MGEEYKHEICPNCGANAFYPQVPRCAECGFVGESGEIKGFQSGDRFYSVDLKDFVLPKSDDQRRIEGGLAALAFSEATGQINQRTETLLENDKVLVNYDGATLFIFTPVGDNYAEITKAEFEQVAEKISPLYYAAESMYHDLIALKLPVPEEAARMFGKGNNDKTTTNGE